MMGSEGTVVFEPGREVVRLFSPRDETRRKRRSGYDELILAVRSFVYYKIVETGLILEEWETQSTYRELNLRRLRPLRHTAS
jgi:hypothetical protein